MRKSSKSILETHPHLAAQAYGWNPAMQSGGTMKKLKWICQFGHIWESSCYNRTSGRNCPVCSNRKVLEGFNDLATTHPEIAKQASGWDPKKIVSGSTKKLKWICQFGHIWESSCYNRTSGRNCPVCSNRKVLEGFNDLATTHPEIAKQASGWDPGIELYGSNKRVMWECMKGHHYVIRIVDRTSRKSSCSICPTGKN